MKEPEFEGYYYARVPALDLTTHGKGVEGALAAAKELTAAWIAEKRAHGEPVPVESQSVVTHIEIPDALLSA
ncbi:MAG: type II toxin-antitoxin system HicB family antitoxin [Nitrospirota bacterium]